MHQTARLFGQMLGDRPQADAVALAFEDFRRDAEMPAEAVLEKVVLLPAIERCIEDRLEDRQRIRARRAVRIAVENQRLVERPLIERATLRPRVVAAAPEIGFARVLHDDQPLGFIVKIRDRHPHAHAGEEARDGDVVLVLRAILAVAHEDERLPADVHAPELAARPALFDREDGDGLREVVRRHGAKMMAAF